MLPKQLLKSPKSGFGIPLREWFKDNKFVQPLNNLNKLNNILDSRVIDKIILDNKKGNYDYGNFIWSLFMLLKSY